MALITTWNLEEFSEMPFIIQYDRQIVERVLANIKLKEKQKKTKQNNGKKEHRKKVLLWYMLDDQKWERELYTSLILHGELVCLFDTALINNGIAFPTFKNLVLSISP